jgi:hypothetical protein
MLRQSEGKKQKRAGEFYCLDFKKNIILKYGCVFLIVREIQKSCAYGTEFLSLNFVNIILCFLLFAEKNPHSLTSSL